MIKKIEHTLTIPDALGGLRLDQALTKLLPEHSRTEIQRWIKTKELTIDNREPIAKEQVLGGEQIVISAIPKSMPNFSAQAIDLNIIHEDEAILVINKPVGMVVHPSQSTKENTLLNALLYHCPDLKALPRAGIIHRLDKDTSGLLVVAKTASALKSLSEQLKKRSISRIYQAIVSGVLASGGTIDEPITRHPIQRKKMAVIETGKTAITHYRVIEKYRDFTRLKVQLETGRTHQIRVHFAHLKHPLLGDQTYGGRLQLPKGASPELVTMLRQFKRQALHAIELGFVHPITQKPVVFDAPLPTDMRELIAILKKDALDFS
jgi:23S rRNA pseudouridine1911/1915/1917 synthase